MSRSGEASHAEARRRLLDEGIRSYLEAATALIEYRREVQKRCRQVMERNLQDYASALAIRLTKDEIEEIALPSFSKWEGEWWSLGVKIIRTDMSQIRWWESHCCLSFESGDHGLYCWIGEWFPNRKMASTVFAVLHKLDREIIQDGKDVWLEQKMNAEQATTFDECLDTLFQRWIGVWKKVGGIKAALSA